MHNERQEAHDVLLCVSVMCDGDIDVMYDMIINKKGFTGLEPESTKKAISSNYRTLLDQEYPKKFCNYHRPPLVLYYKGDFSLIQDSANGIAVLNGKNTCDYATKSLVAIIKEIQAPVVVVLPVSDTSVTIAESVIKSGNKSGNKVVLVSDKALDSNDYTDNQKALLHFVLDNGGLVLTEVPDGSTSKTKKYYQMRLVSLCSSLTIVGGVTKRDPCIHSIATSMELGHDVYCIPFEIGSNYINNELISDGAILIQSGNDVSIHPNT